MRFTEPTRANYQMGTAVGTGGTVVGTGIDWSTVYEPSATLVVTVGATPSGTAVATLQQGTALAAGYTNIGTINTIGTTGGTATYELDASGIVERYLRCTVTSTGGTALVAATIHGKPRTVS